MAGSKAILEPGKAVRLGKANQAAFPAKGPRSRAHSARKPTWWPKFVASRRQPTSTLPLSPKPRPNPLMWMHRHEILNEARHTYPRTIGLNLTSLCPANFPIIMPSGQAAKHGLPNLLHLPSAMHHLPSSSDTGLVASPVDRLDGHAPCRRPCFGPAESHCKSREASRTTITSIIVVRVVFSLVWGPANRCGTDLRCAMIHTRALRCL